VLQRNAGDARRFALGPSAEQSWIVRKKDPAFMMGRRYGADFTGRRRSSAL
jgi:hypothetical protein